MPPDTNTQTDQLPQIIERVNQANNVLVTVSNNPSVDQLAACIGLTLALNKQGKHATAVFSGKVPSTLEFLQPEKTIETNTNSLRDFIISLDKSKADKLRYKVEDDFVKIFITPYRTSIDEKDLAFTQGDFNIDLIITLGVHERTHLDAAIVAHGRILHDAVVVSMTTDTASEIGTMNWVETESSSLCEMTSDLVIQLNRELFDAQIATALLTGMVAETDRFGNEKARPHTMSVSGVLMAAGASPQLISTKLEEPVEPDDEIPAVVDEPEQPLQESGESTDEPAGEIPKENDGTIQIDHNDDDILIDEHGKLQAVKDLEEAQAALEAEAKAVAEAEAKTEAEKQPAVDIESDPRPGEVMEPDSKMIMDPPQLGGQLTANSVPEYEQYSPSTDPMSNVASSTPLLERTERHMVQEPITPPEMPSEEQTLMDIEKSVASPHLQNLDDGSRTVDSPSADVPPPPPVDNARAAVDEAVEAMDTYRPEPINALGATPVDLDLSHTPPPATTTPPPDEDDNNNDDTPGADNLNTGPVNTPPPVPPPLMPPGL